MPLMILSTQKYKMGTGKLSGKPDEMRGGNLAMELASHPEGRGGGRGRGEEGGREGGRGREGGSSNTPSCFMLHRNWDKLQLCREKIPSCGKIS